MASFDVKRVTPLEWAGIGAGALAFITSFLPWYTVSFDFGGPIGFSQSGSVNAWNANFGAWFPMLVLIAVGVVVLLPHLGTQVPNQPLIWLGAAAAAFVIIILRWVTFPSGDAPGVSAGAGFGLFVGLVLALVSGVAGFLSYRASSAKSHA
jgi:hypothetical protein